MGVSAKPFKNYNACALNDASRMCTIVFLFLYMFLAHDLTMVHVVSTLHALVMKREAGFEGLADLFISIMGQNGLLGSKQKRNVFF